MLHSNSSSHSSSRSRHRREEATVRDALMTENREAHMKEKIAAVLTVVAIITVIRRAAAAMQNLSAIMSAVDAAMEDRRVDRAKIRAVRLRSFRKVR